MVLLLGLNGEKTERMAEAVEAFLERLWHVRCRSDMACQVLFCFPFPLQKQPL